MDCGQHGEPAHQVEQGGITQILTEQEQLIDLEAQLSAYTPVCVCVCVRVCVCVCIRMRLCQCISVPLAVRLNSETNYKLKESQIES